MINSKSRSRTTSSACASGVPGFRPQTIAAAHQAGADTFVAGNAVFASADPAREVQELRRRCMVTA